MTRPIEPWSGDIVETIYSRHSGAIHDMHNPLKWKITAFMAWLMLSTLALISVSSVPVAAITKKKGRTEMNVEQHWVAGKVASMLRSIGALVFCLSMGIMESSAMPIFYSTTAAEASHWQVSTSMGGADGQLSSFSTANFQTAVSISGRPGGWIANNSSGSNSCCVGNWTFFVFRQTFDLTGYDATSADLRFQWAADDSGEGFAARGTWRPKYRVNGGALIDGVWPTGNTYSLGPTVELGSGFVAGLNMIDFYVEGNGVTDGFSLKTVGFTAQENGVPEPATGAMALLGLGLLGLARRRKQAST